jgi:hypothetical protein
LTASGHNFTRRERRERERERERKKEIKHELHLRSLACSFAHFEKR